MDANAYSVELREAQEEVADVVFFMCREKLIRAHYVFLILNKWYMSGKPDSSATGQLSEVAFRAYCPDVQLKLGIILDEIKCPNLKTYVKEEFCCFFETYSMYGPWFGRRLKAES